MVFKIVLAAQTLFLKPNLTETMHVESLVGAGAGGLEPLPFGPSSS